MSALKERYQNPTCGDSINLRLFTYNSNNRSNVQSIEKVDIFTYDPTFRTAENPHGLRLVQSVPGTSVIQEATGQYLLQLDTSEPLYTIGEYQDVWSVTFENGECATAQITNRFKIYSDLWFTTPIPPIYDFNFDFRPNKIRKGSKRYLLIQITPNVPRGAEILPYYENLAIVSDLRVSIELACGECVPAEQDLRLLVDRQLVDYREKGHAYYFIDTCDYDEGIYNIWFELAFGENVFVSDKNSFQVYS
jgi:hypothetical protein